MEDLIKKHGLADLTDKILAASRPCLEGITSDESVTLCGSKVGGNPHVPVGFQWPFFKEFPLEFVAQINCAEFTYPNFPNKGLLLFFQDNQHWGYSPKDAGFIRVIYYPDVMELQEIPTPVIYRKRLWGIFGHQALPRVYKEAKLVLRQGISLPSIERGLIALSDEGTEDAYCEVKEELQEGRFVQIGGFPNPVQNDGMEAEIAQMTSRGSAEDWIMILEVYCDKKTDMMWGDAGRIHFFCHIDDLKNQDFSRCWMQMQCG
jgi:uncharacterized protein YwqG